MFVATRYATQTRPSSNDSRFRRKDTKHFYYPFAVNDISPTFW